MRKLNFYLLLFVFCFVNISNSVLRAETVTYYINDVLGSPVAAMDQSGRLLWRESYNPFGEGRKKPSQNANDIGFTGHQKDDATGLTYMQARYYDPTIGRFYGIDPVGYTSKNPVMSFNKYIYVNNNPYKYTDPTGEFFFAALLVPELVLLADFLFLFTATLIVGAAATEIVQNSNNESDSEEDWESDYEDWASGNSDTTTTHGKERESRGVDKEKARKKGEKFKDTESGAIISVDGPNVVVDGEDGNVTQWGDQTEEETSKKVTEGVWEPIDDQTNNR